MKSILKTLLTVFLLAAVVAVFQNQRSLGQDLEFSFLKWHYSLILGFWILFAFLAGAAVFALANLWNTLKSGYTIRKRDQEIAQLEKELSAAKKSAGGERSK
jgi:uncharacterized integral membrane protein